MKCIFVFLLILGLTACAEKPKPDTVEVVPPHENRQSKYRQECSRTSEKFKGNLPSNFTEVWCANDRRHDFGPMGPDVIHAIIVAAFYEKRMDRRISAMNMLEKYECNRKETCEEFHYLLNWGIKSGHPRNYSKDLSTRENNLREKVSQKLKKFK